MSQGSRRLAGALLLVVASAVLSHDVWARDRKPPKIRHTPIAQAQVNQAIEVRVSISDRSGVFDPTLYYRTAGATEFLRATLVETGSEYVATIPAAAVTGDIEYFVEAYDELGNGPSRVGGPSKPLRISTSAEAPPPIDNPDPNDQGGDATPDPPKDPNEPTTASNDKPPNGTGGEHGGVAGQGGTGVKDGSGEVKEEEEIPWAIIAAGVGGAVLVVAGVVATVVIISNVIDTPPPGEVTIVVTGPAPYTLRGEP